MHTMERLFRHAVAAAAALLFAVSVAPAGASASTMAAPAKRFVDSQMPLRVAIKAKRTTMQTRADRLTKVYFACRRAVDIDLGSLDRTLSVTSRMLDYFLSDREQEALNPIRSHLAAQADRYERLSTGDRLLDRAARAQARSLRRLLAVAELDSCATLQDWAQNGFTDAHAPEIPSVFTWSAETLSDGRVLALAAKRLRADGLSAKAASRAAYLPFDDETPPNEFSVEVHAEGSGEVSLDTELG